MKIGIMTFWWSDDNYGQLLQCYALQKYLNDAGHEAYLIRYDYTDDRTKNFLKKFKKLFNVPFLLRHIRNQVLLKIAARERNWHPRSFNEFRQRYVRQSDISYATFLELQRNPPDADIYMSGSDQIWNVVSNPQNSIPAYFLAFGNSNIRRMSYAASFGISNIDQSRRASLGEMLKKFSYVSVREKNGVEICHSLGINDVKWDPDPTLLLDANAYRTLFSEVNPVIPKRKWCFVYMLNNECNFDMDATVRWANKKDLDVIYVTVNSVTNHYPKQYPSIPEWLYLIDNAECIITNSFHGCIFSLLFHKQFAVVPLSGKIYEGMNSRLDSLFEQFGIDRILDTEFSVFEKSIDWIQIEQSLNKLRENVSILEAIKQ